MACGIVATLLSPILLPTVVMIALSYWVIKFLIALPPALIEFLKEVVKIMRGTNHVEEYTIAYKVQDWPQEKAKQDWEP